MATIIVLRKSLTFFRQTLHYPADNAGHAVTELFGIDVSSLDWFPPNYGGLSPICGGGVYVPDTYTHVKRSQLWQNTPNLICMAGLSLVETSNTNSVTRLCKGHVIFIARLAKRMSFSIAARR